MAIKVSIADDHHLIAEGVKNMLRFSSEIEVIATYSDGIALMGGLAHRQPDVLLLDINMPGKQGDELAGIIKKEYPNIKIIVLTNLDNIFYIKTMLQHGVNGYVLKDIQKADLLMAIQMVSDGKSYYDKVVYERIEEYEKERKRVEENAAILSRREKEVLKLFAENFTTKEIAEKLSLSRRTIEHHRESILEKLEVKGTLALVKKAQELGILNSNNNFL